MRFTCKRRASPSRLIMIDLPFMPTVESHQIRDCQSATKGQLDRLELRGCVCARGVLRPLWPYQRLRRLRRDNSNKQGRGR